MSTDAARRPLPVHEVLVVDDDVLIVRMLERWLSKERGVHVHTAHDGPTGLALAATHPVCMVFTDIELVGESGVDLVRLLQLTNPGLPICLMSAHMSQAEALGALSADGLSFLHKPVVVSAVLEQFDATVVPPTAEHPSR